MDGSIEATVQGGTPNYTFSLNGGPFQSSNIFDGLGAGTYTITVMDNDGFTSETNEIIINNPPEIIVSVNINVDDVTIDANGGTGGLMYSLDGVNYQVSNEFFDLPNGNYTVYVKDENGCIVEQDFTIAINTLVVSAILTNDIDCHNDNNGIIEVEVEGGTPGFTFSLNGGPFQSSNVFSGLGEGTYTVVVQDANGFTAETNTITIENPEALSGLASVNGYDITVNASGGTGDLQYSLEWRTISK